MYRQLLKYLLEGTERFWHLSVKITPLLGTKADYSLSNKPGYYKRQGPVRLLCAMHSNKNCLQRKAVKKHVIPVHWRFVSSRRFKETWGSHNYGFFLDIRDLRPIGRRHYDLSKRQGLFTNRHITWQKTRLLAISQRAYGRSGNRSLQPGFLDFLGV